ncbi:MAG: hypothetical protein SPJ97_05590 [Bacteroides sp.]|nr:hypothetical protein [Bacteroides sp.]
MFRQVLDVEAFLRRRTKLAIPTLLQTSTEFGHKGTAPEKGSKYLKIAILTSQNTHKTSLIYSSDIEERRKIRLPKQETHKSSFFPFYTENNITLCTEQKVLSDKVRTVEQQTVGTSSAKYGQ